MKKLIITSLLLSPAFAFASSATQLEGSFKVGPAIILILMCFFQAKVNHPSFDKGIAVSAGRVATLFGTNTEKSPIRIITAGSMNIISKK